MGDLREKYMDYICFCLSVKNGIKVQMKVHCHHYFMIFHLMIIASVPEQKKYFSEFLLNLFSILKIVKLRRILQYVYFIFSHPHFSTLFIIVFKFYKLLKIPLQMFVNVNSSACQNVVVKITSGMRTIVR